ncbi:hypothetical protein JIQ42_03167 [Leishmania sp. Namibia]|uniref:hypothetical protein n=1 Tax=Leishmania sp. Namibia TaxID=2802991 RepID=UPI001B53A01A|nr:hypothetical protein JIQ42_03167 [Leishmania sp. Namibia]
MATRSVPRMSTRLRAWWLSTASEWCARADVRRAGGCLDGAAGTRPAGAAH